MRLSLTQLNFMHALPLLYALLAPDLMKWLLTSVGHWTYASVLKWERLESINVRVIRHPTRPTRVTRLTKRTSKRAKDPERINTREKTEKAIWNRLHFSPALCDLCAQFRKDNQFSDHTTAQQTQEQFHDHTSSSMTTTVVHQEQTSHKYVNGNVQLFDM